MTHYLFKPGQSGNPSGRTKEMVIALRNGRAQFLEAFPALNTLFIRAGLGDIELERSQAWAIEKLFERYLGKPSQSIDIDQVDDNTEDASAIPSMTYQDIQMLKNKMVMELIYNLHVDGRLKRMVGVIEDGWRPNGANEESVIIEPEKPKKRVKVNQISIEGKVEEKR